MAEGNGEVGDMTSMVQDIEPPADVEAAAAAAVETEHSGESPSSSSTLLEAEGAASENSSDVEAKLEELRGQVRTNGMGFVRSTPPIPPPHPSPKLVDPHPPSVTIKHVPYTSIQYEYNIRCVHPSSIVPIVR
jgi:hypothetical protein